MFAYQYLCFFYWNVTEYDHRVRFYRKSSNTIPRVQHDTTKMLQSWQSNNKRTPPKCILLQLEGKRIKKGLLKCSFADWFTIFHNDPNLSSALVLCPSLRSGSDLSPHFEQRHSRLQSRNAMLWHYFVEPLDPLLRHSSSSNPNVVISFWQNRAFE